MALMETLMGLGQLGLGVASLFGGGGEEEMTIKQPRGYVGSMKDFRKQLKDAYAKLYGTAPFTFQGQQLGYRTPQARSAADVYKTAAGGLTGLISGAQNAVASQNIASAKMNEEDSALGALFPLMMALQQLGGNEKFKGGLNSLLGLGMPEAGGTGQTGGGWNTSRNYF